MEAPTTVLFTLGLTLYLSILFHSFWCSWNLVKFGEVYLKAKQQKLENEEF